LCHDASVTRLESQLAVVYERTLLGDKSSCSNQGPYEFTAEVKSRSDPLQRDTSCHKNIHSSRCPDQDLRISLGVEVPPYERAPIGTKLTSIGAQTRALKGSPGAVKCPSWLKMHYSIDPEGTGLELLHRLHAMSGLSSRVRNRGERVSPC
jgi:hypothetical protein